MAYVIRSLPYTMTTVRGEELEVDGKVSQGKTREMGVISPNFVTRTYLRVILRRSVSLRVNQSRSHTKTKHLFMFWCEL